MISSTFLAAFENFVLPFGCFLQAELMLFGLLSLLMGHWIVFVAKICVKSSVLSSRLYPCALEDSFRKAEHILVSGSKYLNNSVVREQVKNGLHDHCPEVVSTLNILNFGCLDKYCF